ncbi:gamma-glutamyltransferase family protein [Bacillus sp. CGMCC 1.16541]|uniref:gamma-glutamyltransferase family protein n=1 Tax=Bacillus sp. CGMCC 1.16541 TaxID=2185143 RepID=UPI000D726B9A|nr:gamma-glutamyltransferase family protein [Bacillus sp. CGMCC 1.16541]
MRKWKLIIISVLIISLIIGIVSYQTVFKKEPYAVSTSDPVATQIGLDVLENGGTAVDAAIAISYALGVVEPYGSGIGGGGGMLIDPADADPTFIDYRETAPSDNKGKEGVPGFVAGMEYIHDNYGTLPMSDLIDPSIEVAKEGFEVDQSLHDRLNSYKDNIDEEELDNFYPDEEAIETGKTLKQPDLAKTLERIQEDGTKAFYEGRIADSIKDETKISSGDLEDYEVVEREPLVESYKGNEIVTAPPPFSGTTLIQMLKMVDKEEVWKLKEKNPSLYYHYMGEISKKAYKDRLGKIADPAFIKQATDDWTNDKYVDLLRKQINSTQADKTKVSDVEEHESTTHFVVIDRDGTVVSTTNTLSNFFGSGKNVDGFFLNNTMDTFGDGINKKEEGKRPRTFTAPTIIRDAENEWVLGIGTPGGNRIPQVLTQVIGNYFEDGQSIKQAVESDRVIYDSSKLYMEKEPNEQTTDALKTYGYELPENDNPMFYGGVQALVKDLEEGDIKGAADSRREGVWNKEK